MTRPRLARWSFSRGEACRAHLERGGKSDATPLSAGDERVDASQLQSESAAASDLPAQSKTRRAMHCLTVLVTAALAAFSLMSALGAGGAESAGQSRPAVRWVSSSGGTNKVYAEVYGLTSAALEQLQTTGGTTPWERTFAVYAEQGDWTANIGLPPVSGTYAVQSGALRFEPRYPLVPGLSYRAVFRPPRSPGAKDTPVEVVSVFKLPARSKEATTVVSSVYPSAAVVPENLLKFYLHFSAPMSRGHIYDHIHLRDAAGKEVDLPFLEIDEELWDPAMTRLTLFIDPGRIKRGVKPLEEIGPALEAGKRFTLEIDREWKDAAGNPLREGHRKAFEVGPADRDPPDPARWKIERPQPGTREAITVNFTEPMDHALALRMIHVIHGSEPIAGDTALSDDDRRWTFTPARPWLVGLHQLRIQTTLEDLAGNNIGKPFEVDTLEPIQRQLDRSTVSVPFEVR